MIRTNVYKFSGAKSLTEVAAFSELLADKDGKLKPFNEFKKDIEGLHGLYNEAYLQTEYNTAVAEIQMAGKWLDFGLMGDPWLEYRTMGDDRVRPEHALLEGLTLRMSDPAWDSIYPPNDWNCRCTVVAVDEPNKSADRDLDSIIREAVPNEIFRNNTGKTGIVFEDDHPYFQSLEGIKELDAVKNYGMQTVDKIMTSGKARPLPEHIDTVADYYVWWKEMVRAKGINDTDFALKDGLNNVVVFDAAEGPNKTSFFRDHINRKPGEDRYEYATNLVATLQQPNEIWAKYKGSVITTSYVRYYDDYPYVLVTENDGETIKAVNFYRADRSVNARDLDKRRKGILIKK